MKKRRKHISHSPRKEYTLEDWRKNSELYEENWEKMARAYKRRDTKAHERYLKRERVLQAKSIAILKDVRPELNLTKFK